MYPNIYTLEKSAKQFREELMEEAELDRAVRTGRLEQQRDEPAEQQQKPATHRAWQAIQAYIGSLFW